MTPDTIAAVSTPAGASPRGIVRLSGPDSVPILRALAPGTPVPRGSYVAFDAALRLDGLDLPARIYLMRAPASYTREDIVEVHAPGAPPVLGAVLRAALLAGARPAAPGEFTRRAFLNGRIDLAQAEAVQHLIRARDESELRAAVQALDGALSRAAEGLRDRIAQLCALVEAALDFSDQDIEIVPPDEVAARARALAEEARRASARPAGRLGAETPRVVLRGPANAGKSSLFNALLAADLAIVAPRPGTTRDTLEAEPEWDGLRLCLVDTAGIRPPCEPVEALALARSERAGAGADLVLFVLDSAAPLPPDARAAARPLPPERTLLVANKADLPPAAGAPTHRDIESLAPGAGLVVTSAAVGTGLAVLRRCIVAWLRTAVDRSAGGLALNARHGHALLCASEALLRAASAAPEALDLAAADLRDALDAVGEIAGRVLTDDILDRIFASFCIGK